MFCTAAYIYQPTDHALNTKYLKNTTFLPLKGKCIGSSDTVTHNNFPVVLLCRP